QHTEGEDEGAHADEEVQRVPPEAARVRVHAAGHAEEAEDVHREERDVEPYEHRPEADSPQAFVEHPSGDLRQPEVERAEDREDDCSVEYVMEVGDDEVAVRRLPVEGQHRHHHAGDAAQQEDQEEADGKEHRCREAHRAVPHRGDPCEELDAARHRDKQADGGEERQREGGMPVASTWGTQTPKLMKPMATSAVTIHRYPTMGRRENTGMIIEIIPVAGTKRMYTSGWPQNQKRCW